MDYDVLCIQVNNWKELFKRNAFRYGQRFAIYFWLFHKKLSLWHFLCKNKFTLLLAIVCLKRCVFFSRWKIFRRFVFHENFFIICFFKKFIKIFLKNFLSFLLIFFKKKNFIKFICYSSVCNFFFDKNLFLKVFDDFFRLNFFYKLCINFIFAGVCLS